MKRLTILACLIVGCDSTPRFKDDPVVNIPVPEFALSERRGNTVTNATLQGKVWVASFFFTRCSGPCPHVSRTVAQLHSDFAKEPGVSFVSFTIDPGRDKPDDLKKYAAQFRAEDSERWLFLSGPEATIHDLATNGFKMLAKKSEQPKEGEEFDHSSKLAVVDKHGIIRGYFDGLRSDKGDPRLADEQFATNLAVLKLMIERLLKE